LANKDTSGRITRRFYEILLKQSQEAKKHPEKLIPIEEGA
jgi:hypothetical protein